MFGRWDWYKSGDTNYMPFILTTVYLDIRFAGWVIDKWMVSVMTEGLLIYWFVCDYWVSDDMSLFYQIIWSHHIANYLV